MKTLEGLFQDVSAVGEGIQELIVSAVDPSTNQKRSDAAKAVLAERPETVTRGLSGIELAMGAMGVEEQVSVSDHMTISKKQAPRNVDEAQVNAAVEKAMSNGEYIDRLASEVVAEAEKIAKGSAADAEGKKIAELRERVANSAPTTSELEQDLVSAQAEG